MFRWKISGSGNRLQLQNFWVDWHTGRNRPENAESQDTNFTLLEGVERNAIVNMLKETNGNKLEAAKRLGIGRQTLYNKIKAYGIEV